MPNLHWHIKQLVLTCVGFTAVNLASAQTKAPDIPFEKRTANSPTTVLANQELADIPQFIVDPFWPKPQPNNWLIGQGSGVSIKPTTYGLCKGLDHWLDGILERHWIPL